MDYGQMYIGIILFIIFLIMDIILYAFEAALNNLNENEIEKLADGGSKKATVLNKIIKDSSAFDDTLDIIAFVTTMVSGAYIFGVINRNLSLVIENSNLWISVVTAIMMLLLLIVFGILIPKNCGKRKPEKTALKFVNQVVFMIIIIKPVAFIVTKTARFFIRLSGNNPDENVDNVTEEEIISMVNEGQEQGVLEAGEAEMIANIFEFGDKNAGDIMTKRSAIVAVDLNITLEELIQMQADGNYSRLPVYDGDIDNIIGTLHIRDALVLYRNLPNRKKQLGRLNGLLRTPFFVPDSRDIDDLLKEMQAEKVHMGIVIDEYGQTAGVITMEDIIEEIVGNIMDEYDEEEEILEQNGDDTYIVDGLTELEDLNKLLGIEIESDEYSTLNGFIISKLNRIPEENETDIINDFGFTFKILEVKNNVVKKVEVKKNNEGDNNNE